MASTSTTTQPPAYLLPFLQNGLTAAQNLYNQGGPQYYPGQTVVPFSPQTEASLAGTEARATNGSPVTTAAQNYVTGSLNGDYLNPSTNPYLTDTFNQAAQATQNRLTSEYARAGRNIDASIPERASMLDNLATQIYGGAYNQDRQLQQGVLPYATPLANQDYVDLAALGGVGSQIENLAGQTQAAAQNEYNYNQQLPTNTLNTYLQQIGQIPAGTTTTQQLYNNPYASVLGGALAGGTLAGQSSSSPNAGLWGALAGAVLGGLL